jgi:hypothetical protein
MGIAQPLTPGPHRPRSASEPGYGASVAKGTPPSAQSLSSVARSVSSDPVGANAIASSEAASLMKAIGAYEVADCDAGAAGHVDRFVGLPYAELSISS